jgi:hypothetical protein
MSDLAVLVLNQTEKAFVRPFAKKILVTKIMGIASSQRFADVSPDLVENDAKKLVAQV